MFFTVKRLSVSIKSMFFSPSVPIFGTRLAVGRVIVYKSRGLDKTGGPFSYHTSLEPGLCRPSRSCRLIATRECTLCTVYIYNVHLAIHFGIQVLYCTEIF
jgi:hypothetical protein